MSSSWVLIALIVYGGITFGWRSYVQHRRTGSTGFRGIGGAVGSAEWIGGVLFVVAMIAVAAAPIADLLALPSLATTPMMQAAGVALFVLGFALTVASQLRMGDSWRIGVDTGERTALVDGGVFCLVRNPIFSSMWVTVMGVLILVPNVVALTALVALSIALQMQVRLVEEPHLLRTHGDRYRAYATRVGRFVPGLGRL